MASSVRPATMVGSAKGRSTIAFTKRLPRKSSRTSTHASSVPATALTATTSSDAPKVSSSAATDCRLETARQKPSAPSPVARHTTAASGSSTIRLRYADESPSAMLPRRRRTTASGCALVVSRHPEPLLDPRHHALLAIEELVRDRVPAAEFVDREQAGRLRVLELREHALHDRPVALLAEDPLGLRRAEEVDEGLCLFGSLGRHGDGVLDQDRLVGDDVVDVLVLRLRGDRLVLVREQDVALAAGEGLQRLARALVLHRDVREQPLEVLGRLLLAVAELEPRAVCRHDVPARAARRERVRRDHLDAVTRQVVPGLDAFRIALADDEDDDRIGDHAVVLVAVPVVSHEPGVDEALDVRGEGHRDHVRRQARLDGAALLAGAAVRLVEGDSATGARLLERRDDLLVRLPRRRVRDQRELSAARVGDASAPAARGDEEDRRCERAQDQSEIEPPSHNRPLLVDVLDKFCKLWRLRAPR